MPRQHLLALTLVLLVSACANKQPSGQPAPAASPAPQAAATAPAKSAPNVRVVKSRDGSYEGEVIGTARPGSQLAKLSIGMHMNEVQDVMGRAPDRFHTYESGKRWIPFYFGNDARRMQALYNGEGCLIFTEGNIWGGAGGDLIQIQHDATGGCYQP